jgi:hypothetical protein
MALSKAAKSGAVKGALGDLMKMLGGLNMDRARKKKAGKGAPPMMAEADEGGDEPDDSDEDDVRAGGKKKTPKKMPAMKGGMGGHQH